MTKQGGITTRFLVLTSAFLILMAPIFMMMPAQKAFGASKTWDGGGDGIFWEDCENWNQDVCPAANDAVTIGTGFDVIIETGIVWGADGSLTIESGATLYFEDESIANHGTIYNSGRFEFYYHERTALYNFGTIINEGYFGGVTELRNGGIIQNKVGGTVEVASGDSWYNTGTIINEGTFLNRMGISNDGTITNRCGGTFTNQEDVGPDPVLNEPCTPTSKMWDGGGDGENWTDCLNWNSDTCPTGNDAITIDPGFNIIVDGYVLKSGGSITISSGSKLVLFHDGIESSGTIHNKGKLEVEHDDSQNFHNAGTVINDGLFDNQGTTINHETGRIQNNAGSTFVIQSGGNVVNDGSIINNCGATFDVKEGILNGDGTVENEACSAPSCDNPTISGTNGNDVIDGTPGADVIDAKSGDDTINGLGGNDIICAGDGNDTVNGGGGSDTIFGGKGNDVVSGGRGNDNINGGAGNDSLSGNGGNDKLFGSSGNDKLNAKDGIVDNDSIDGGFGTDTCNSNPDPEVSCEI